MTLVKQLKLTIILVAYYATAALLSLIIILSVILSSDTVCFCKREISNVVGRV